MVLREIAEDLPRLRHRQREQLGQLDRLRERFGLVDLVADDEQRVARFDEQPGRPFHFRRIGPDTHPRIDAIVGDDLRADALVVVVLVPVHVRLTVRRVDATLNARRTVSAMESERRAVHDHLVSGVTSCSWPASSWNASRPASRESSARAL